MAWCRFQDEGEALCLLQAGALATYTLAGELQTVPLPSGFTAMWALPQGLLLVVGIHSAQMIGPLGAVQECRSLLQCHKGCCCRSSSLR